MVIKKAAGQMLWILREGQMQVMVIDHPTTIKRTVIDGMIIGIVLENEINIVHRMGGIVATWKIGSLPLLPRTIVVEMEGEEEEMEEVLVKNEEVVVVLVEEVRTTIVVGVQIME